MRNGLLAFCFATAVLVPFAAVADPCAGFVDVDTASSFCPAVAWMKSRQITVGCDATHYCPADVVTRVSMALFMNRLATAQVPGFLHGMGNPVVGGSTSVVGCQTTDFAVTGYPRLATGYGMAYIVGPSDGPLALTVQLVYSTDAGVSWQGFANFQTYLQSDQFGSGAAPSVSKAVDFAVGQSVRFGMSYSAARTTVNAGCELNIRLENSAATS